MSTFLGDLRLAFRALLRNRAFAWAAVVTLALGIGANVAVLSFADRALRSPLPYPDAQRLVYMYATRNGSGWYATSYPTYRDWASQNRVFSQTAVYAEWRNLVLHGGEVPLRVHANFVSASYFPLLGASPHRGRFFTEEEDRTGGANQVVVLSYGLWQSQFGADPGVVGRTVTLNDVPYVVLGVMAQGFKDLSEVTHSTDVWVPITTTGNLFPPTQLERRTARWMWGLGRLRDDVTFEQARADMQRIGSGIAERFPDSNMDFNVGMKPLKQQFYGDLTGYIRLIAFSSLLILLVAAANFAGLLAVRALDREGDAAVRSALGGSRLRIARPFLLECLVLAVTAGIAGILVGAVGTPLLLRATAIKLPGFFTPGVESGMWAPVGVASLLIGVTAGLLAAWRLRVEAPAAIFRETRALGGRFFGGLRGSLLVAEVALSFILLVGAGLMIEGFTALQSIDLGFDDADLLTMGVDLSSDRYQTPADRARFVEEWTRRASELPGVSQSFAWSIETPGQAYWLIDLYSEGTAGQPDDLKHGYRHAVSASAPRDLGLTLLEGRWFTDADRDEAPAVAIISQGMADAAWSGEDPIGKRFKWRTRDTIPWVTVVGLVADAKLRGRRDAGNLKEVYLPYQQFSQPQVTLMTRATSSVAALGSQPVDLVRSMDPDLAVSDIAPLRSLMAEDLAPARFSALLLVLYAGLAVVLAGSALYGLLAYTIRQRTRELGLRIALGADHRAIAGLVFTRLSLLLLAGVLLGLASSLGLAGKFRERIGPLLSDISVFDARAYLSAPIVLALIAVLAAFVPLVRALRTSPAVALREE